MQKILLALAVLFASDAYGTELTNPEMSKSYDGKSIQCVYPSDLNGIGYQPLLPWVRAEGAEVKISFSVAHVICEQSESGLRWNVRRPYTPWPSVDIDGNPTTFHFSRLEFLLVSEGRRLLQVVKAEDAFMQMLDFSRPLEESLERSQRKALEKGEGVRVRWEFFLRGSQSAERAGKRIPLGQFTGGSYYIDFTVQKDAAGALSVTAFQVR
jgi:hypothetical protein